MSDQINLGDRVQGCVRKNQNQRGTVTNIFLDGNRRRFDVTYDNSTYRTETQRAIEKIPNVAVDPRTPDMGTLDPIQTATRNFVDTLETEFFSDDDEARLSSESENSMDELDSG